MVGKSVSEKIADKKKAQEAQTAVSGQDGQPMDWKALNEKWAKEAQEAKDGALDGTITNMTPKTAGEVYGDAAKDPARQVISIEITASDGKKFTETFSMPEGAGSWRNKAFKLGIYLAKYGKTPNVGDAVKITFNAEGFYRLAM